MASQQIYQFYAELDDYKPRIWRRFQVPGNITMARLGYIVMTLYEMQASHLFALEAQVEGEIFHFAIPDDEFEFCGGNDRFFINALNMKISRYSNRPGTQFLFNYDFGDDWRVALTLEEVIADKDLPGKELPRVIEGAGYGIIEDCGGIRGLEELTKAFKAKRGRQYKEFRDWLGVDSLDLAAFDLDDMNFRLKKVPRIYADIYERRLKPTKRSMDLLLRKYKEQSRI